MKPRWGRQATILALACAAGMPAAAQNPASGDDADTGSMTTPTQSQRSTRAVLGIQGLEGIGLGAGVINYPAYRGASSTRSMVLPVPYLHYEGDFFKSDKYGTRADLFNDRRIELSISASLSPPVNNDVPERRGMPELKPTVELGPQLDLILLDGKVAPVNLRLRLPVRQAITLENSPRNVGMVFSPNLNLDVPLRGWSLGMVAGPIFANRKQHAYFYDVAPQYATPVRPAYQSAGGYSGSQLLLSLSRKMGRFWFGSYVRYDDLYGAAFVGSPLVTSKHYLTGGVALIALYE